MKVICYVIEEINDEYSRRVEKVHNADSWEDAHWYKNNYNRNSSEMNSIKFMRIAEVV